MMRLHPASSALQAPNRLEKPPAKCMSPIPTNCSWPEDLYRWRFRNQNPQSDNLINMLKACTHKINPSLIAVQQVADAAEHGALADMAAIALGHGRIDAPGKPREWQALYPDFSGARQFGEENAFPAKNHGFD